MKKYEYRIVVGIKYMDDLQETLNKLGSDGWRVSKMSSVIMIPTSRVDHYLRTTVILEREIIKK